MDSTLRILLVGYGKMGRLVGELAPQYGCEVAGVVDPQSPEHGGGVEDERWAAVAVAGPAVARGRHRWAHRGASGVRRQAVSEVNKDGLPRA